MLVSAVMKIGRTLCGRSRRVPAHLVFRWFFGIAGSPRSRNPYKRKVSRVSHQRKGIQAFGTIGLRCFTLQMHCTAGRMQTRPTMHDRRRLKSLHRTLSTTWGSAP